MISGEETRVHDLVLYVKWFYEERHPPKPPVRNKNNVFNRLGLKRQAIPVIVFGGNIELYSTVFT
jgi:hypothetical protein